MAAAGILLIVPSLRVGALLMIAVWSFARAYYFAFYVIEHYTMSIRDTASRGWDPLRDMCSDVGQDDAADSPSSVKCQLTQLRQ
jgi:predicted carbohydrate-binding protein with CBM5 and CBM33 domain